MKRIAAFLSLATLSVNGAAAAPLYFSDPGMIIRPDRLMQRAATDTGGQARLVFVSDPAGLHVVPAPVPEPCSAVLLPLGGAAVLWSRRRRSARDRKEDAGQTSR